MNVSPTGRPHRGCVRNSLERSRQPDPRSMPWLSWPRVGGSPSWRSPSSNRPMRASTSTSSSPRSSTSCGTGRWRSPPRRSPSWQASSRRTSSAAATGGDGPASASSSWVVAAAAFAVLSIPGNQLHGALFGAEEEEELSFLADALLDAWPRLHRCIARPHPIRPRRRAAHGGTDRSTGSGTVPRASPGTRRRRRKELEVMAHSQIARRQGWRRFAVLAAGVLVAATQMTAPVMAAPSRERPGAACRGGPRQPGLDDPARRARRPDRASRVRRCRRGRGRRGHRVQVDDQPRQHRHDDTANGEPGLRLLDVQDAGYPDSCKWASIAGLKSSAPVVAQGDETTFPSRRPRPAGRTLPRLGPRRWLQARRDTLLGAARGSRHGRSSRCSPCPSPPRRSRPRSSWT